MKLELKKIIPSSFSTLLKNSPILQKVLQNTSWLFIDQCIRMGAGLIVGILVARHLGPERYGLLKYSAAFVIIFAPLAHLWLAGIVIRDIARAPENKNEILGSAFFLLILSGTFSCILSIILIFSVRPEERLVQYLVIIISGGYLFQAFDTIDFHFQAEMKVKYPVVAKNIVFILLSIGKIGLIIIDAPLIAFAGILLAEAFLGSISLLSIYRFSGFSIKKWRFSYSTSKKLLSACWPLTLSQFAVFIQSYVDQIMLGQMISDQEVGQYSAALNLIQASVFLPSIIIISIAPVIAKLKTENEYVYHMRLLNLYRFMFILFITLSLPIFLFAEPIIHILYGSQYQKAGLLLPLFAFRMFFLNFGLAKSLFITNEDLFKYALFAAVLGAISNVLCNLLLIPLYQSIGAIIATIISFSITIFLLDVFFSRTRKNLKLMLLGILTFWKINLIGERK